MVRVLLCCRHLNRLDAFLKRCTRYGYFPDDFPNISELFSDADDQLFSRISLNVTHVLKPLLPTQTQHSYNLRDRRHKSITGILSSGNCINIRTDCMCGFYYVLSGVAFCQLLLNEYCIVYCIVSVELNDLTVKCISNDYTADFIYTVSRKKRPP